MTKLATLLLLVCAAPSVYGQQKTLSPSQIDSIALSIDSAKELRQAVHPGKIRSTDLTLPPGQFTETFYAQPVSNQLMKVVHDAYFQTRNLYTYYFYNDQLVLVTALRQDQSGPETKTLATGKYYFLNHQLVHMEESGKGGKEPKDFLWQAGAYLRDVKTYLSL